AVGIGTPKLSISSLKDIKVPLVSLEEQEKFAHQINIYNSKIRDLYNELKYFD
ncbi:hypothetical protein EAF39_10515, partial [Staphylococcus pseudintermedius]|nr:hypothetical protein [Staphylococcus pseudintermedius]